LGCDTVLHFGFLLLNFLFLNKFSQIDYEIKYKRL
jgi:hypothetical protein